MGGGIITGSEIGGSGSPPERLTGEVVDELLFIGREAAAASRVLAVDEALDEMDSITPGGDVVRGGMLSDARGCGMSCGEGAPGYGDAPGF